MKKQMLSEKEYREAVEKFGEEKICGHGAEAIYELLKEMILTSLHRAAQ